MAVSNLIGQTVLGGYTVTELLGSGAFGTVYKAVKKNPAGEYVRALKHIVIPSDKQYESVYNSMGGDLSKVDDYFSEMLKSIVTEIQILNDLSEKGVQNIVRYYENDIVTSESPRQYNIYILMEYLTPFSNYISQNDFTVKDVMRLGLDVLQALDLCHENGVIHRDIKDDNIFVSSNAEYKIGDFGVSKVLKDSSKAESIKGTPNFLAPEVYLGKESYTKSVDLYSLGIVLYRLLNYSRNPFLPQFPDTYTPTDEDFAFEARMKENTPELPSLGGEEIGRVVVKAITSKDNRYTTAKQFYEALETAMNNTQQDILDAKVNITASPNFKTIRENKNEAFAETIAEAPPSGALNVTMSEEPANKAPRNDLFSTVGDKYDPPVPEVSSSVPSMESAVKAESNFQVPVPPLNTPAPVQAVDDSMKKKIIYIIPLIFAAIGLILYFVAVPMMYGGVISFVDWLISDPENVISTLRDPDAVFSSVNTIIAIRVVWYIWLIGFIASLFFVGKQLQAKPKPDAENALMTGKDPYFLVQEISSSLKLIKQGNDEKELDTLAFNIKKLDEKLSVESDFGYGKGNIITCENNIAAQLQFLRDVVPSIKTGNLTDNINKINSAITNINNLLVRRREMKRK